MASPEVGDTFKYFRTYGLRRLLGGTTAFWRSLPAAFVLALLYFTRRRWLFRKRRR